jgi:hypothetical protein
MMPNDIYLYVNVVNIAGTIEPIDTSYFGSLLLILVKQSNRTIDHTLGSPIGLIGYLLKRVIYNQ